MKKLVTDLVRLLDDGQSVVLATIIDQEGSTPRTAGARMIVRRDGAILGTVGGGLLEARVMSRSPGLFESGALELLAFDLGGDPATGVDMICGGRVDVLMEVLRPGGGEHAAWKTVLQIMGRGGRAVIVGELRHDAAAIERHIVSENVPEAGGRLPSILEKAVAVAGGDDRAVKLVEVDSRRFLVEPVFGGGTVFLFGAGHVSREVAGLLRPVDFGCVVIDDRPEFANAQRFPSADGIIVASSFQHVMDGLAIDRNSYLVIVTRGHRHDEAVLEQALRTGAGYVGMIGSRRKRDAIYENLRRRGIDPADLDRVHSPIGLPIRAETPAEIAVSIVAQLIDVRAQRHARA